MTHPPKKTAIAKQGVKPRLELLDDTVKKRLMSALPPYVRKDEDQMYQFMSSLQNYLKSQPALMRDFNKDPEDILRAAAQAAELNLRMGTDAHIVPFGGKPTMTISYKGKLSLWRRNPDYVVHAPQPRHRHDVWEAGLDITNGEGGLRLKFAVGEDENGDRGEIIGYFMYWYYKGKADYYYMSIRELEEHVANLRNQNSLYDTHKDAMYRKTVIHKAAKYADVSPDVTRDEEVEYITSYEQVEQEEEATPPTPPTPPAKLPPSPPKRQSKKDEAPLVDETGQDAAPAPQAPAQDPLA